MKWKILFIAGLCSVAWACTQSALRREPSSEDLGPTSSCFEGAKSKGLDEATARRMCSLEVPCHELLVTRQYSDSDADNACRSITEAQLSCLRLAFSDSRVTAAEALRNCP